MPSSRRLLVLCYGLFAVAAEILLFREYMTALAGRDLGIGLFPITSFFWLAAGAFLSQKVSARNSAPLRATELLLLACVPTFGLQYAFIILPSATASASHTAPPLYLALGWSLLSTAPMGIFLGLLFPLLCRWVGDPGGNRLGPLVALVTGGGIVGGLGVTILLDLQLSSATIFMILTLMTCISATLSAFASPPERTGRGKRTITAMCLLAVLATAALRGDRLVTEVIAKFKWNQTVPGGTLTGHFATAHAEYLYGTDQGRWIVASSGSVHETVGDAAAAGWVAALVLCQNSMATHVLVIGDGFSLCERILQSPQIEAVDWYHPDPAYVRSMGAHLPEGLLVVDERLNFLTGNIRTVLANHPDTYDIVIVNLPSPMNIALAQFASVEFFDAVESSLRGLGLLAFGVPGDAREPTNYPAYLGASIYHTLHASFAQTIVVPTPGRTFLLAGTSSYLESSPVILEIRFSLIRNAEAILPPASLSSLYLPDLTLEVLKLYDAVDLPEDRLLIRDGRPNSLLCDLLAAGHRCGISLIKPVQLVQRGGPLVIFVPLVLLALGRLLYVVRTIPRGTHAVDPAAASVLRAEILFVIASMAATGVAFCVVVMRAFQQLYGSLYLNVGLITALFLVGLTVGIGAVGAIGGSRHRAAWQSLYPTLCALAILGGIHAVGFVGAGLWFDHVRTWPGFALLLSVGGAFGGTALGLGLEVPQMSLRRSDSLAAGVTGASYAGAALGSAAATMLLIPLVGMQCSLFALAAPTLAAVSFVIAAYYGSTRPGPRRVAHATLTPVGYGLLTLAACFVADAHVVSYLETSRAISQSTTAIQEWIENRMLSAKTATLAPASKTVNYLEVREGSRLKGYVLRSEDFTDTVYGYGGPMSLVLFADPNGALLDYHLTRSRETPRYLARIRAWMESLKGRTLFGSSSIESVHSISGATLSCDAILKLLRRSGQQFAASVLAQEDLSYNATRWVERIDWPLACWLAGPILAFVAIWHGRLWSRIAVLAYTAIVGGFWLNRQYSTDHVMRLLEADNLLAAPIGTLCLLLGVPLLVLLFGNIFCGYLCPFGALQELLSYLVPRRFKTKLPARSVAAGRFVKYLVLFVLVVVFFTTRTRRFLEADPLTMVFTGQFWKEGFWSSPALVAALCVLAVTLLLTRLWCRYLCPTGAFLSLLNAGGWLGRFLPAKKFGRCEFGLSGRDHLDCIYCDRCRYDSVLIPSRSQVIGQTNPRLPTPLFLVFLLGLSAFTLSAVFRAPAASPPSVAPAAIPEATSRVQDFVENKDTAPAGLPEPIRRDRQRFRRGRNNTLPD